MVAGFIAMTQLHVSAGTAGGPGDAYCMISMTRDTSLAVTFASAANQSFARGYAPVAISMITITDDPATPVIKNGTPIVVRIPADLAMTWDEADMTATFGGTAAGKVGTISYAAGNKHLVINVTADFAAGDTLTISDLSFKNYLISGTSRLELDFDNDGSVDSQDDKTITIVSAFHYGGIEDGYAMGVMREDRRMRIDGTTILIK